MKTLALPLAAVAAGLLGIGPALSQDFKPPLVDGRINVSDNDMKPVFLRDQRFYPGEIVTLRLDYRVDAMRRMHEDRECWSKWFGGIDCHYVKRSDSADLDEPRVPLILDLLRSDGGAAVPLVTPPLVNRSQYDTSRQLPIGTTRLEVSLTIPQLETLFGDSYVLQGRVAPLYGSAGSLQTLVRRACEPFRNGEYCSQGEYVVRIVSVDASRRVAMLERWLDKPRTSGEIDSAIDDWMIFRVGGDGGLASDGAARIQIAKALLRQVTAHHKIPAGGSAPPSRLDILTLARRLDPENSSVSSAIVATQVATGDVRAARATNKEQIDKYQKQYEAGARTEPVLRGYGEALRDAAGIYLARSFQVDPADTLVAIDYLKQSAQIWSAYIEGAPGADVKLGTAQYVSARLEEARTGARVSDLVSSDKGIDAVRDARSRLPLMRDGLVVGLDSDGTMLVVTNLATLAEVDNAPVPLAFVPVDTIEVLDTDPLSGRALLREAGRPGLVTLGIQKAGSRSIGRDLQSPRLTLSGIVGVDAGTLVRQADGKETTLATLPSGVKWAVASMADVVVTLAGDGSSPPTLIRDGVLTVLDPVPLTDVTRLALSRDGSLLAVEGVANGPRTIVVMDTATGKVKSTASLVAKDASDRLTFTANGQRLVASHKGEAIETIDAASGTVAVLTVADAQRAPVAIDGRRLLVAHGAATDPIRYVSVIDTGAVSTGPIDSQPEGAVTRFELGQHLPESQLVALYRAPDAKWPAFAVRSLGTADSPVVAHLVAPGGARGADVMLTDWHPQRSFPVGTRIAVNPGVGGGAARLIDPDRTSSGTFAVATGTGTRIVPIGVGSGFAVLSENARGGVIRADIYSAPKTRVKTIDLDQRAGYSWATVSTTVGPMMRRQQSLMLVETQNVLQPTLVPTRLATIDADGTYWSGSRQIAAPDEIVAVGAGGGAILRQTAVKVSLETDAGSVTELADCSGKPGCTLAVYQTAPMRLTSALETPNALELQEWTIGATVASAECKECSRLSASVATESTSGRPFGFPVTRFALSAGRVETFVTIPSSRALLSGPLSSGRFVARAANGMPLYSTPDNIAVQVESSVQIWKSRKP